MTGYFHVLTAIDIFVLSFMCILTKLSESLNKKQKRGFFLAFVLIAGISVLEVVTLAVNDTPSGLRWLNIVSNYLGFGLSPAVSLCLVYVLDKKTALRRGFKAAVCCEIAYLIFLALSIPYGLIFSVSADNVYARGKYFYIYVIVYFAAILYLSVSTIITGREFQNRSRALIYPLMLFLTAETVIQIALPDLHVTWLCVTLLSVLYFTYCNEMWNQLDALTGLFNRRAFQAAVDETLLKRIAGVFIFIDVGNVKDYNDKYGHANGDLCLKHFAATMKKCFPKDSILGRYGGDEFVVYIKNAVSDDAHRYMDEFQREISHLMMSGGEHVTVSASAGGVVFIGEGEDFVSLCRSADNMLYDVKRNGKGTFKIKGAKKAC